MTLSGLRTVVSQISGFSTKVAYRAFPVGKAPALPFICISETGTDNFGADNIVYQVIQNVDIELYTKRKDVQTERKVEAQLHESGLFWEKTETYIESENCYEIVYSVTL